MNKAGLRKNELEKLEPLYIADGNIKCHHFWKSLIVPQNVKHKLTIGPSNSTPRYAPKRTANIGSQKNLNMHVHSSAFHNSHQVETTQMYIN